MSDTTKIRLHIASPTGLGYWYFSSSSSTTNLAKASSNLLYSSHPVRTMLLLMKQHQTMPNSLNQKETSPFRQVEPNTIKLSRRSIDIRHYQTGSNNPLIEGLPSLEMPMDPKILEKSPLTPERKDILHRIDILKEPLTKVAKDYGVTKGTMSKRHSTALKRYNEFASSVKSIVADEAEKFRAKLEQHERQLDIVYGVLGDYSDYLSGLKLVTDRIGPFRAKNCVHNVSGKCAKWPLVVVGPRTCGICIDFVHKETTDLIDPPDTY